MSDELIEAAPCRVCAVESAKVGFIETWPADNIAMAPQTDGTKKPWPLCEGHTDIAMCAGWFPIYSANSPEGQAVLQDTSDKDTKEGSE